MDSGSRYPMFEPSRIHTYPVAERPNKVRIDDLISCNMVQNSNYEVGAATEAVDQVAAAIAEARSKDRPVIVFTGAHLIKNGLSHLLMDLVRRRLVTLVATNGAGAIHDFELALIGETSENVPDALGKGRFGMAYEFAYFNRAIAEGQARGWGLGESLGAMICRADFRAAVERRSDLAEAVDFQFPQHSLLVRCYQLGVPLTVHVGIGTDVTDQHPSFDGAAKGGCSARDFLIFAAHVCGLAGGVFVNIGSAVTGPEVLLKAVSMAANVGNAPSGLTTADFDLRPYRADVMADERHMNYYFRDQKSIATRVPEAFGGRGIYVEGDQLVTVPRLYQRLLAQCA